MFPTPNPWLTLPRNVTDQCTMSHRLSTLRITVPFARADYRVFVSAARRLRRIMGRQAPDVLALIRFNLHDRDATGLADDYLDAIRWPNSEGRVVSLRRRKPSRAVRQAMRSQPVTDTVQTQIARGAPSDPARN